MIGSPLTICESFDRAARWFPGREAVVDSRSRLTFRELDEQSRRCAALFRELGADRGRPVALLSPPSTIYVVAWLGAIRCGAVPMALHTRESADTLAEVCAKMEPTLLVYDASMETVALEIADRCAGIRATVRAASNLPPALVEASRPAARIPGDLMAYPLDVALAQPGEDDAAIIALSSGTTSIPKGVVHTHRSLLELARTDLYLYAGLKPSDRSLVPLSTAFIGCYNGWFPFLNAGACAVFMERFDIGAFVATLTRERISHAFLTPTLWRRVLAMDLGGADFSALRQIGFGAEPMDAPTLARLRETISRNVVQVYGSTETGAGGTCIWAEEMVGERLTSVGRPMLNGDLRVVTPGGGPQEEVAAGEIGEILLSSPSLADRIWNDPELTDKSFIRDGARRWWRSRDLGRLDQDGYLFIEGRHDDMIVSGGINVMPARVEEALLAHPGVAECAVIGVPDPEWGERVQAYVVSADPGLTAALLDAFVRGGVLSAYQRPQAYIFVEELPRTGTNKVNRKALRERSRRADALK